MKTKVSRLGNGDRVPPGKSFQLRLINNAQCGSGIFQKPDQFVAHPIAAAKLHAQRLQFGANPAEIFDILIAIAKRFGKLRQLHRQLSCASKRRILIQTFSNRIFGIRSFMGQCPVQLYAKPKIGRSLFNQRFARLCRKPAVIARINLHAPEFGRIVFEQPAPDRWRIVSPHPITITEAAGADPNASAHDAETVRCSIRFSNWPCTIIST